MAIVSMAASSRKADAQTQASNSIVG